MAKDVQKVIYHNKSKNEGADLNSKWWKTEPEKIHEAIWPLVTFIRQSQSVRHNSNHRFYKLYNNQTLDNLSASRHANNLSSYFGESAKVTFNVVKSCVDTANSKISKNKPRPMFVTENGDWHLQQKAKRLNNYMLALFDQMGSKDGIVRRSLYDIGAEVFFDAAITGTGAAKMTIRNNRVVAERFLSDELIVDQFEGMYRTPRSMHQIKYIDREVLYDIYPDAKHRSMIERARSAETGNATDTQDMVPVIESYHLMSGESAKDGKRSVTIETGTLHSAEWDKEYFPFLVQRWTNRPIGYFGIGLAEELQGIQREINQTLRNIQTGLRRVAVPRTFLHIADVLTKKNMTNEIGEYVYYKEKPPIISTPVAFNAETYNHLDRLFSKAFELTGLSQLSAQSAKPPGLNAAVAMREYQDIESERFATVHKMYENFFTPQATYMAIDLLDTLLAAGHDTVVQARDGITFQPVKYSEVQIPRDSFTVRSYPTAYLPAEPAGKFNKIQELLQGGFYTPDEARQLFDVPDLDKVNRIKNAMPDAITAYIEGIIETGEYQSVEPYQDMAMTKNLAQAYFLQGRANSMPEDRLDLLRRILNEVQNRQEEMEREAMAKQQEQMLAAQAQQMQAQTAMQAEAAAAQPLAGMPPDPAIMQAEAAQGQA